MVAQVIHFVSRAFTLSWLTGPIFDKELRVSSRRRRNYVLRSVYLALLTIFIVLVWLAAVGSGSQMANARGIYQMSEAGKAIIATIIWFQFCATQLVAVIMLSTAISDEIYHRTLGVLMTTPINSLQIVMGKLLSKLWQLLILLAISLPLLAIVRVFGGVPWEFVISSLCITLTAIIFAGSVSIFFSIRHRRAYSVILRTIFTGAFLYAFIPFLMVMIYMEVWGRRSPPNTLLSVIFYINPFAVLWVTTAQMFLPRGVGGMPSFSWPGHCAVMLGASAVVLGLSIRVVRKVALRQATGEAGVFSKSRRKGKGKQSSLAAGGHDSPAGQIKRVRGQPVVWKELKTPLLRGGKVRTIIGIVLTLVSLFTTYHLCREFLDEEGTHIVYVLIFVIIGMIGTAVLSATSITTEKESRTWPILLATPLSGWQIIIGKAVGVFRRCLPVWILLFGHVALFVIVGFIHWIVLLHMLMLVVWLVVFFTGSGLYFSSRFKRTTTAVVMNIALGLIIWAVVPLVLLMITAIGRSYDDDLALASIMVNPVVHAGVALEGGGGVQNARLPAAKLRYSWPESFRRDDRVGESTRFMLLTMAGYSLVGILFAWRAKKRLRRSIF